MRRFVWALAPVALLLLSSTPALSMPSTGGVPVRTADPPPAAHAAWTVALYVDADNDLDRMWRRFDAPELRRLPLDPRINVVALVDHKGRGQIELVRFGGGTATVLARYPERNFGSPASLTWFLQIGRAHV